MMETVHRIPQPMIARAHDVATAADWGLINGAVPADELDAAINGLVDAIAASSPLTVGVGKAAFYAQIELDEHRVYDHTKVVMAANALAAHAQEGICAFLAKRKPPVDWAVMRAR